MSGTLMRKVAILGGTFDPVHWGHLLIAETALNQVALEQVIWVPTRCPPHKLAAKFENRWEMVQRAIADHPAFTISPLAANRGTSYAVQTLIDLKALYPNTHWYWLVGLDAFQTLPRWYRRQELASACDWLVVPRLVSAAPVETMALSGAGEQGKLFLEQGEQGSRGSALCPPGADGSLRRRNVTCTEVESICKEVVQQLSAQCINIHYQLLQLPLLGVSSSLIRQYCRDGSSIRYLVPEAVRQYITKHNLYAEGSR